MTLKKRLYISGSITVLLIILSIMYRNAQSALPLYLLLLISGIIFYMSFFYVLETGKLKRNNTNWLCRNISRTILIILLLFYIALASQVDDNKPSYWVISDNLYSLIKIDPDTAQEFVLKLYDMMRFIIYKGKEEKVTLDEKISYLNNFIALQTARYQIKKWDPLSAKYRKFRNKKPSSFIHCAIRKCI